MIDKIKFNGHGLVPCVVQDVYTKEVLMLAYMNEESLKKSIETKETWFYSRSRQELWNKGATSGHKQFIKKMSYDCDGDTILVEVEQIGVACHTGAKSCFFETIFEEEDKVFDLSKLYNLIKERKENPVEGSYTNYLFDKGIDKILKKVGEESAEVIIAAKNPDLTELQYELSDLVYHSLVLMVERGLELKDIAEELKKRLK
ncbi:MAG: bifunctional phosphoribosyl-AMP cyclohydrolase/phosphoribosyl-ATP diphosphatase HisIE [Fusobacteriaceae bacterium]|nr:bifunctional phosphoribosyl-AMP cyclohydrolase/phosphoribosyl-ATP diphosphatase HisIE [Fusobacteriaceae bacterium]MBN2837894.1 bifunctional phosphoribosyl-AMP cyclohydrolase/phosphoribosyl-ATP diphosphatase HisIE [Fusobacteriaceae bacterium]